MQDKQAFKQGLVSHIPNLRAFAYSLCGNMDKADDYVQETLMKAWAAMESYEPNSNMKAWLFTILRNVFYSECRKRKREVEDADGALAERLSVHAGQHGYMDLQDLNMAIQQLPAEQREALILVGATGLSYEEAAEICHCAVGTIKSRVSRARLRLNELLTVSGKVEVGPDDINRTVLGSLPTSAANLT